MSFHEQIFNSRWTGFVIALIGVVMYSAKAVLVKLAYLYEVDTISLLLLRMILSLPFYLVIAYSQRQQLGEHKVKTWLSLVFFGFIGYYLASLFDFIGLVHIKAGLERLILFVYPTLVILFSRAFLKTKISSGQVMAIVMTYFGIIIAFYNDVELGQDGILFGGAMILLSAICYAGYLVGSGWLIPKFGATAFTSFAMIVSCICVIAHYGFTSTTDILGFQAEVYWIGLSMAIFSTVVPSYLVSYAIKIIGASNFSIIGSFGPISTILLAYIFLSEELTVLQGIGTIVVIMGVMMVSKKKE